LRKGEVEQRDVVGGVVGGSVARPEDASQRLPTAVTAVQIGQQRVEPECVLVAAGRALFAVGVGDQQGRVQVKDQPSWRAGTGTPRSRSHLGAGRPQRGHPVLTQLPEALQHPPGRRDRGHRPQQRTAAAQQPQVAEAVATIGQHHDQVAQHPGQRVAARPATTTDEPVQRRAQPEPVSQLCQQRHAGMAYQPVIGDHDIQRWVGSLHYTLLG
jgi:hypothetical protein